MLPYGNTQLKAKLARPIMESVNVKLEWMLMPLFCSFTGYTVKAVQRKIEEGKWLEGRMYRRAPDGHVTLNLQEYYRWVRESGQ